MPVPSVPSEFAISMMSRKFGHSVTAYNNYQLILSYECGWRRLHRTIGELQKLEIHSNMARTGIHLQTLNNEISVSASCICCMPNIWMAYASSEMLVWLWNPFPPHRILLFVCSSHTNAFWMCLMFTLTTDSGRWKGDSNAHSVYLFHTFTTDPTTIFTSHR